MLNKNKILKTQFNLRAACTRTGLDSFQKKIWFVFFIILIVTSFSHPRDIAAFSVATTDNFFATKVNPAALGFGNAAGVGFAQYFEDNTFKENYMLFLNMKNLGYCYEKDGNIINHSIALGSKIEKTNLYLGSDYTWNKKEGDFGFSTLYRPWDFFSFGANGKNILSDYRSGRIGMALRPISFKDNFWNGLTISYDIGYKNKIGTIEFWE